MKFPLVVAGNNTLMIASLDFFKRIGRLDFETDTLEMNVTRDGKANLYWLLDADGLFYDLIFQGSMPLTVLQKVGLRRKREKFQIGVGRRITAKELIGHIVTLRDQFVEAPNVSDFLTLLISLPAEHLITQKEMSAYLGE
jgi:hypothetical protein